MKWTTQQEKAITERHKSLLVSAAAGSGKTAVLVQRVMQLVLDEDVSLDRMLIVTFTNAAAAEMKERIYKALSAKLADDTLPRDRREHLRTQMNLIGRANISTFSKFALEIVHRYYHVAGLKPGLAICDEARKAILQREALDELMEGCYEEDAPEFRAFLDRYATSRGDGPVRTMILDFSKFLESLPDPQAWTKDLLEDRRGLETRYCEFVRQQAARRMRLAVQYFTMAGRHLDGLPKLQAKNGVDVAFVSSLLAMAEHGDLAGCLDVLAGPRYETMSAAKDEKEDWEWVKPQVSALRDRGKEHVAKAKENYLSFTEEKLKKEQEMLLPQLRTLISLTEKFSALYGAKKALLGLLDFSDIEHFALRILEDPGVQQEYRSQFDHVFVDEYQDSNLVQEELIARVSRPDNVFKVGDVKQSIYKFRLAEPELFLQCSRRYRGGEDPDGEVIDLNSNFRSKKEVIDLVNRLFSKLMSKDTADMEYTADEALVKGSGYEGPLSYQPEFYLIETAVPEETGAPDPEEESVDAEIEDLKAAELEARNAVELIRRYHGKPVYDDKKQCERPLEYRDMAILLRAVKGDGEIFYQTLSDEGIPVFLERTEGYFDTVEIQVFLNLLRIIDNRSQDVPLLSVLRSPVFGFSASDLAAIRIWAKARGEVRTPYNRIFAEYQGEGPDGPLKEKCLAFSAKLDLWRRASRHLPLGDFLWQLLTESGYATFAAAVPAGTQRLANLRALADKAQAYESENAGGLYGFINYIDAINDKGGKVDLGQVKILSESEDVVRIMTIHKSKGLEFPFVLLAGLGKQFNNGKTSRAAFHKDYGASLRLSDPSSGLVCDPLSLKVIRRKKDAEELAENIRVLYVALTRPKDIILMSGTVKNAAKALDAASVAVPGDLEGGHTYVSWMLPLLQDLVKVVPRAEITAGRAAQKAQQYDLAEKLEHGFRVREDELPVTKEEIARRLDFCYEPPADLQEKRKYSVSQIAAMEREKMPALPKRLTAEGEEDHMDAASRGTAYHTVMEHLPFTPEDKDPDSIRTFMDGLVSRGLLTQEECAVVDPRRISAFFASQTGKEAVAAKELYKEAPFTIRHEMNGRQVLVQGTIDCFFRQEDGWVLVDYKSNYIDRENEDKEMKRLRAEYLPQLALYREALEGVTRTPVKKAVLYLFGIDKEISIDEES